MEFHNKRKVCGVINTEKMIAKNLDNTGNVFAIDENSPYMRCNFTHRIS